MEPAYGVIYIYQRYPDISLQTLSERYNSYPSLIHVFDVFEIKNISHRVSNRFYLSCYSYLKGYTYQWDVSHRFWNTYVKVCNLDEMLDTILIAKI